MTMRGLCLLVAGTLLMLVPSPCHAGVGPELDGLASFGISLGVMNWLADEDAREHEGYSAQIRPIGKAVFRYRPNSTWTISVETGYGWNSYAESDNLITWVVPTTVGLERRLGDTWGSTTALAFGAGFYVWGQRRDGNCLQDPVTHKDLNATDPGAYLGLATESHLTPHVTFLGQIDLHFIYSTHKDDFTGRLGGNDLFLDLRLGVNYYFSPYEGLVWGDSEEQ
jgi:hypothetical protein